MKSQIQSNNRFLAIMLFAIAGVIALAYGMGGLSGAATVAPYDVNGDGKVDSADLIMIRNTIWNRQPMCFPVARCDLNGDGVVDGADLQFATAHLGKISGTDSQTIAEEKLDVNGDQVVDALDLIILDEALEGKPSPCSLPMRCDFNNNGKFDASDRKMLLQYMIDHPLVTP